MKGAILSEVNISVPPLVNVPVELLVYKGRPLLSYISSMFKKANINDVCMFQRFNSMPYVGAYALALQGSAAAKYNQSTFRTKKIPASLLLSTTEIVDEPLIVCRNNTVSSVDLTAVITMWELKGKPGMLAVSTAKNNLDFIGVYVINPVYFLNLNIESLFGMDEVSEALSEIGQLYSIPLKSTDFVYRINTREDYENLVGQQGS